MDSEFRRVVIAMLVAMGVFFAYHLVINALWPPQPAAPGPGPAAPAGPPVLPEAATGPAAPAGPAAATAPQTGYAFRAAEDTGPVQLGGRPEDALRIDLHPRGGSLMSIWLCARDAKGRYVHRTRPDEEQPYRLLAPVEDGPRAHFSYATRRIGIQERGNQTWDLAELPWQLVERSETRAAFRTTLTSGQEGGDLLRLTKTYALRDGKAVFELELAVANLGSGPLTVWIEQDGPLGIPAEDQQYDMRSVLTAQQSDSGPRLNKGQQHAALQKATRAGEPLRLVNPDYGPLLWTALTNKYFAVFTRPRPAEGAGPAEYVADVRGLVAVPGAARNPGDLLARLTTRAATVGPGGTARYVLEVYAGPKDSEALRAADPAYVDRDRLYYQAAQSADGRCCTFCAPPWLRDLMVWLLQKIHRVVRNYGIAIIILVLIIRTLLHPLAVFQQKSMFRMQEAMARMQPKMQAIKEKFANDKVRQNQELMKLWAEEGVNPAANFVSFVPLLLQMPILIALWTALNTDLHLRHAPFDGWWITDLSAPDAFWTFSPPVTVPILSAIPFLGGIFTDVQSINLLPILMGVSMWLQQKYMPKPQVQARLESARAAPADPKKPPAGLTPQQQLRQQQIMMYMMAILFPLMFYRMPSGLNLYWMATNVFGIFESLIIRRQIEADRQRRQQAGPQPPRPRPPGLVARFLKRIAAQAEELQRKADKLADKDLPRKKKR